MYIAVQYDAQKCYFYCYVLTNQESLFNISINNFISDFTIDIYVTVSGSDLELYEISVFLNLKNVCTLNKLRRVVIFIKN